MWGSFYSYPGARSLAPPLLNCSGQRVSAREKIFYFLPQAYTSANFGTRGSKRSFILASFGVMSSLTLLHFKHAATKFIQESSPPRERGRMWSMVEAAFP